MVIIIILFSLGLFIVLHSAITEDAIRCRLSSGLAENISTNITPVSGSYQMASTNMTQKPTRRLPQAIIIGSRKSGTRALLKFLELNPAIRAAHNEVHFFDKAQNYKQGFEWYRSRMPESKQNEITIEKSPAYFVTRDVPERIKAMNSSIKLILIFRNPVTRLISDFSQLIANRIEASEEDSEESDYSMIGEENYPSKYLPFINSTKLIWDKAEKEFENYVLRPDEGIDDQRKAVKVGMYSVYLEKWRAIFPFKQFHFVDGEALISNPAEELQKLEFFLGLKPIIKPSHFIFNSKKGFFCIVNRTKEQDDSNSSQPSLELKVRNSTLGVTCLSRSKGRRHVTVRRSLVEELNKFYAPYNEYLYSLTGRQFNWNKT